MRRLFFRCPYGHFICRGCCPFDAWTHDQIDLADALFARNPSMKIEDFVDAGIDKMLIRRIVIIESLTFPSTIECIDPRAYVINGKLDTTVHREW